MIVLLANGIDLVAAFIQVVSGTIRKKAKILVVQTVQLLMQTVSMLLLGGVTGAASNVLSCIRNYVCYKDKMNTFWKVIFIAAYTVMTILLNDQGLLGLIPATVNIVYILFMDIKNPIQFKILLTTSYVPWIFYSFIIKAYVGAFFDAATVVTNVVTICLMIKQKKQAA